MYVRLILFCLFMSSMSYAIDWKNPFGMGGGAGSGAVIEDSIEFGGRVTLHIEKSEYQYKISLSNGPGSDKKSWYTVDSIQAISQFSGQQVGLTGDIKRVMIEDGNRNLVNPTTWFLVQTNNSIILFFKGPNNFESFEIPFSSGPLMNVTLANIRTIEAKSQRYYLSLSTRTLKGETQTLLVDYPTGEYRLLSPKYLPQLSKIDIDNHKGENPALSAVISGTAVSLQETLSRVGLKSVNRSSQETGVANQMGGNVSVMTAPDLKSNDVLKPSSMSEAASQSQVDTSGQPPESRESVPAAPKTSNINIKLVDKDISYQIYTHPEAPGIFVRRLSDSVTVKMTFQSGVPQVNSPNLGFQIKDGILSHPNLARQVDLSKSTDGVDYFKIESTFVPSTLTDSSVQAEENRSAIEFLGKFTDARKAFSKLIAPSPTRDRIIKTISDQVLSGDTVTQVLVGNTTDKNNIQSSVAKKIPRTWKALIFDTGAFGDISMVGTLSERAGQLRQAYRTVPTVLFVNNMAGVAGFGSVTGSKTDILELISPDFADEASGLKWIATTDSAQYLKDRVKTPDIVSSLNYTSVSPLSNDDLKLYLKKFLSEKLPDVRINDDTLDFVMEKTAVLKSVNPEPRRSEDFLRGMARELKTEKGSAITIRRSEVEKALTYLYGVPEQLATEKAQIDTMTKFMDKVAKDVVGHQHILAPIQEGTEIGLASLHSGRGGMLMEWIEGPPGVGKTEMAKAVAKATGVPLAYIDMNMYKKGMRSPNDLLKEMSDAIDKNPHSVLLLDEVEKADPKVLEVLLKAFSNQNFDYFEVSDGQNEQRHNTLVNSTVILTANTIGADVLNWFMDKIQKDERYERMSSAELDKEFKQYLKENNVEITRLLEEFGIPAPLISRVRVHIAYPPGFDTVTEIMRMKIREAKATIFKNLGVSVNIQSADLDEVNIVRNYVRRMRNERINIREILKMLETDIMATATQVRRLGPDRYKSERFYNINPITRKFEANLCLRFYGWR
ncbi:MAG: AAA family ATPase [Bdellovibrionaceae bacterium]|nr:AAA family ATPase [Pseudobdellovibrionaceae bacterium]